MNILNVLWGGGLAFGVLLGGAAVAQDAAGTLKVGDRAPDFTLEGSDGKAYSLRELLGQRPVVIAWFPKAFTAG